MHPSGMPGQVVEEPELDTDVDQVRGMDPLEIAEDFAHLGLARGFG